MHGVGQARNVLNGKGKSTEELVKTQINKLDIPERGKQVPNFSPESISVQIENAKLLKVVEATGEATLEGVVGQIEVIEAPQVIDPGRDGPIEPVL